MEACSSLFSLAVDGSASRSLLDLESRNPAAQKVQASLFGKGIVWMCLSALRQKKHREVAEERQSIPETA